MVAARSLDRFRNRAAIRHAHAPCLAGVSTIEGSWFCFQGRARRVAKRPDLFEQRRTTALTRRRRWEDVALRWCTHGTTVKPRSPRRRHQRSSCLHGTASFLLRFRHRCHLAGRSFVQWKHRGCGYWPRQLRFNGTISTMARRFHRPLRESQARSSRSTPRSDAGSRAGRGFRTARHRYPCRGDFV